jgi:heat shock protein HslJ
MRTRPRVRHFIWSCLFVLACSSSAGFDAVRDREWTLTSVENFASLPAGDPPTLRFGSDGRMSANTGCNSGGADYTVSGDRLDIGAMVTTKRACIEQRRNELESAFVGAVQKTRSYRVANGALELLDTSGDVVARFR